MTIIGTRITTGTERSGMSALIDRWRRMVDDAGTITWDNSAAQEILDAHRIEFTDELLQAQVRSQGAGLTPAYTVYRSRYRNLEGTVSGNYVFRVHDGAGGTVGAYTVDCWQGVITFTANQAGLARYLDASSYDLYGAAADAWTERLGSKASLVNFSTDGQSFSQAQWFDHCQAMAAHYNSLRPAGSAQLVRSDITGGDDDD